MNLDRGHQVRARSRPRNDAHLVIVAAQGWATRRYRETTKTRIVNRVVFGKPGLSL
jgi:hypothetical protein